MDINKYSGIKGKYGLWCGFSIIRLVVFKNLLFR
jgi:hypothetical protein